MCCATQSGVLEEAPPVFDYLTQLGCPWIWAQADLSLGKKMGEGAYGRVYKAGYTPGASVKVGWLVGWSPRSLLGTGGRQTLVLSPLFFSIQDHYQY